MVLLLIGGVMMGYLLATILQRPKASEDPVIEEDVDQDFDNIRQLIADILEEFVEVERKLGSRYTAPIDLERSLYQISRNISVLIVEIANVAEKTCDKQETIDQWRHIQQAILYRHRYRNPQFHILDQH